MYMSYCRFEGTRHELNACISEVYDHVNEEAEHEVSDREIREFRQLVHDFVEMLQETEIIDETGEVDEDVLNTVCAMMGRGYREEDY